MQDARRAEIEAKKRKLLELRKAREDRKTLFLSEQQKREAGDTAQPAPGTPSSRREIDSLVASLLGPSSSLSNNLTNSSSSPININASSSSSSADPFSSAQSQLVPGSPSPGTPSRSGSFLSGSGNVRSPLRGEGGSETGSNGFGGGGMDGNSHFRSSTADLIDVQAEMYELPPKQKLSYSKSVQTSYHPSSSDSEDDSSSPYPLSSTNGVGTSTSQGRETEEEMKKRIIKEYEEEKARLDEEIELEKERLRKEVEEERLRELTEDQRTQIYSAPDFLEFVESSSKIVQRALSDGYDYIKDYTSGGEGDLDEEEGKSIKLVCSFSDERWTQGRSVTDLDWSPKFPELSVASYSKNPRAVNDPDGLVCVWNMHLVDRPEFVFHSQTDVLSVSFSPFHSNLIFGGTYSGQILLWDTRAKHLPVLKTPLSAAGHTYPVYGMKIVGTQNAHNLITSSTDGMVCSWLADMLAQPQETLDLRHPAHSKTDEVAITTLDFPANETTTFWVGTEEGNVYQANRYDRAGAKAGLNQHDIYKGHSAPVTRLAFHPGSGSVDFSDLFLTSSVDWTVKLWRSRAGATAGGGSGGEANGRGGKGGRGNGLSSQGGAGSSGGGGGGAAAGGPTSIPPIYSFEEATDYVYDVQWHPVNPAVFGTVDGTGKFDLWNLNVDTEVPILSAQTPASSHSPSQLRSLNKLAWDKKDGRRAALGSSDGTVLVYDVGDAAVPRESEWTDMQKTVAGMLAARGSGQPTGDGGAFGVGR